MTSAIKAAQTTLSQNLTGKAHDAAPAGAKFSLDDVPDQSGKVAVITGGSEGIGFAVSHTLLTKNIAKLYFLSLNKDTAEAARDAVREEMSEDMYERIQWIQCDIGDWKAVVEAADKISSETDRLDILVNNAARGIMTYQLTDYGIDRHMAVNHFGHVILTSKLLPLLKKTAEKGNKVRISNQASNAHEQSPKDTKFGSVEDLNQDLGAMGQYGRSKLAQILYTRYLAATITPEMGILVNATHPGIVETEMSSRDIHEPYPLLGYGMSVLMKPFKKDTFEAALPTLYATTVTEKSGEYICPPADPESGSELAQDKELGKQLMKLTNEVLKEKGIEVADGTT